MSKEIEQKDLDEIEKELENFIDDLAEENSSLIETHKNKLREKVDELADQLKKEFPDENGSILEDMVKDLRGSVMSNSLLAVLENDWYQSLSIES